MNKKITTFLDDVCIHIKCKAVHKDIRDELTNHICELKEEYANRAMDEEKALEMAISAMGNCDELGNRLNKQHKPKTEWSIIVLTAIIAAIGGIIMYVSSKFSSFQAVSFERYLLYAVIGFGVLAGIYFFDYTKLKKLAFPLYIITLMLLLFTLYTGADFNGRSFLTIGGISIASDYVPIMFLAAIAGFMEKGRGKGGIAFAGILALSFISLIPVLALPNLPVAFVLIICYAVLIISSVIRNHFGGYRRLQLAALGGIGFVAISIIAFGIIAEPYRFHRISTFITRGQSDPYGEGWQQVMADKWFAASALLGKSAETVNGCSIDMDMPGLTSNYILLNVIATLGWVVGLALVLAIAVFIGRLFITTRKLKNTYGFYLSLGACTILSAQFIFSVLMNFSLLPLTDINMPFVSYGGVGYIANMALVGIILSVWRRNNLISSSSPENIPRSKHRFISFEDGKLIISFK